MDAGSSEAGAVRIQEPELRRALGLDLDADDWMGRVREFLHEPTLGMLGPYELLAAAGHGGQGQVFKARQPRTGRMVAIKRMAAGRFSTPEVRARFQREVEVVAALDHPHIVTVFGSDELESEPVLVMQWIDGVPLDRWVRGLEGGSRPLRPILSAFLKICDAVHYAHQRGVIHRDLKPSNILVDGTGQPHVLDFGLARRSDDSSDVQQLTVTGAFLGTPAYAPPEQLTGQAASVDVRGDVYSLGAILFQALTGEPPVEPGLAPREMARRIEQVGPRWPARAAGRDNREIGALVLKALQFDAGRRYASVDSLRADVERFLAGEPVLAHPPSRSYQLRKFMWRNRVVASLATVFLIVVVAAALTSTLMYFRAEHERSRTEVALKRASAEVDSTRGAQSLLLSLFTSAGSSGAVRGTAITVREMLDRAAEQLEGGKHTIAAAEAATLRMTIADAYRNLGLDAKAEPHYQAALELRKAAFGAESLAVAQSLDALGRCQSVLGQLQNAEKTIEAAWVEYVRVLKPGDGYLAQAANSVALIKKRLRKYDEAEKWYLQAIEYYSVPELSDNVPYASINLGALYVTMGRLADAEVRFRSALSGSEAKFGVTPNEDTAMARSSLADVLAMQGDPGAEADALFIDSYLMMLRLHGPHHFRVAQLLQRYARHLSATDRAHDALGTIALAHDVFVASQRWVDVLATGATLADLLWNLGRPGDAIRLLEQELERADVYMRQDATELGATHFKLGQLLRESARWSEAAEQFRCAEAVFLAGGNAASVQLAQVRAELATLRSWDD